MDSHNERLAPGDNSEKFDLAPVEPVATGDTLAMPAATAPDLNATAPVVEERPLTAAEKLVNPALLQQMRDKVREFSLMAKVWKDVKVITSAAVSAQLNDFMAGARGVWKVVDAQRKEAKRPYDEDSKQVQALFEGVLAEITKSVEAVKPMQEAWIKAENTRIAAEKAELAREAKIAADKAAADLAAAQETGDIAAVVQAEADAKAAEKVGKAAARPETARAASASGAAKSQGLRRSVVVELTGMMSAVNHFKNAPELAECLVRLATTSARAAGVEAIDRGEVKIPGFNISTKESL